MTKVGGALDDFFVATENYQINICHFRFPSNLPNIIPANIPAIWYVSKDLQKLR